MNKRFKELALQAGCRSRRFTTGVGMYKNIDSDLQKFAELIVKDHLALLQQEWYDINNAPICDDESSRDVGIRVGKKGEVITLMHKIRKHFEVTE